MALDPDEYVPMTQMAARLREIVAPGTPTPSFTILRARVYDGLIPVKRTKGRVDLQTVGTVRLFELPIVAGQEAAD